MKNIHALTPGVLAEEIKVHAGMKKGDAPSLTVDAETSGVHAPTSGVHAGETRGEPFIIGGHASRKHTHSLYFGAKSHLKYDWTFT